MINVLVKYPLYLVKKKKQKIKKYNKYSIKSVSSSGVVINLSVCVSSSSIRLSLRNQLLGNSGSSSVVLSGGVSGLAGV